MKSIDSIRHYKSSCLAALFFAVALIATLMIVSVFVEPVSAASDNSFSNKNGSMIAGETEELSLSSDVEAASVSKTEIGWTDVKLFAEETDEFNYDYWYERKAYKTDFTVSQAGYVRVKYRIEPNSYNLEGNVYRNETGKVRGGKVRFILESNNKELDRCNVNMNGCREGETDTGWFYFDVKCYPGTNYTLKITSSGNMDYIETLADAFYSVEYCLLSYSKFATKATMKKKVTKKGGSWVKIGKFGEGLPHFKKISYGKKKIVDGWSISNNGTIYVWANKKGKCTVTLTLKNGRKYKTRVIVKAGYPNFMAYLYNYKTRKNYFVVKVKNLGASKLTIIRKGAKVTDKDYRSYDRRIKGKGSVTINPGKTKYVRFYVNGRTTWPDYEDFTLHAKFKYEGKKYKWKTGNTFTWYKKGKKWFDTFWDFETYNFWD